MKLSGTETVNEIYVVSNKADAIDIIRSIAKIDLTYNTKTYIDIPRAIGSQYTKVIDNNPVYYLFINDQTIDIVAIIYDKDIEEIGLSRKNVEEELRRFLA